MLLLRLVRDILHTQLYAGLQLVTSLIYILIAPLVHIHDAFYTCVRQHPLQRNRSVLITGASSGIGAALAVSFAKVNTTNTIYLLSRNEKRLKIVAEQCAAVSPNDKLRIEIVIADVTDRDQMQHAIKAANDKEKDTGSALTTIVANAGIASTTAIRKGFDAGYDIADVNVSGTLNTVIPAVNVFLQQGFGEVILMSSVGSFLGGVPFFTSYAASKCFGRVYGESLRIGLEKYGVRVLVATPSFVDTPLVDKVDVTKISASSCAHDIVQQIEQGVTGCVAIPTSMGVMSKIFANAPDAVRAFCGRLIMRVHGRAYLKHPN